MENQKQNSVIEFAVLTADAKKDNQEENIHMIVRFEGKYDNLVVSKITGKFEEFIREVKMIVE